MHLQGLVPHSGPVIPAASARPQLTGSQVQEATPNPPNPPQPSGPSWTNHKHLSPVQVDNTGETEGK